MRPKHTGIFSGYRGWKKSCTTTVHGLKLLHGTVRPIDGPPLPPTSMLRGFVVGRLLAKCLLDPPPFRMEKKLHHFGFPNWTAGSTSNIDVGGKGGHHCTSNCPCWIGQFHCQHESGATFLTSTDKIPHSIRFSSRRGHFVSCSCGDVLVVWQWIQYKRTPVLGASIRSGALTVRAGALGKQRPH